MNKKLLFSMLIIFTVALSLSSVNAGLFDFVSSDNVEVKNLEIVSKGYSMYDVNCELTPKNDFSYLEMIVITITAITRINTSFHIFTMQSYEKKT